MASSAAHAPAAAASSVAHAADRADFFLDRHPQPLKQEQGSDAGGGAAGGGAGEQRQSLSSSGTQKYVCPECRAPFANWGQCARHLKAANHANANVSMKGVQQLCMVPASQHGAGAGGGAAFDVRGAGGLKRELDADAPAPAQNDVKRARAELPGVSALRSTAWLATPQLCVHS